MAADAVSSDSGYTNRPSLHAQRARQLRLGNDAERGTPGRTVNRMRLALQAYEQRAQRRAELRGWLAARAALSTDHVL